MVDNNGVWMLQQSSQLHGNLRETESATTEDLESIKGMVMPEGTGKWTIPGPVDCSQKLTKYLPTRVPKHKSQGLREQEGGPS